MDGLGPKSDPSLLVATVCNLTGWECIQIPLPTLGHSLSPEGLVGTHSDPGLLQGRPYGSQWSPAYLVQKGPMTK